MSPTLKGMMPSGMQHNNQRKNRHIVCGFICIKLEKKLKIAATRGSSSAEKMGAAQLIKYSLCKHEDLCLLPGTRTKK